MHIVVTGGAGFLGTRLCRALLAAPTLAGAGGAPAAIESLTVLDRVAPPPDVAADPRVAASAADLVDAHPVERADVVFHLAAAVSGECERDFDLGMRTNLDGTLALLARCRAGGQNPVVVFASSLAVFGAAPGYPMPDPVTDATLPVPQTSYGIQKFIGEQLVADYTRKGYLRGRSVRIPTVSVRAGAANAAASSYLSSIIREPLAGERANCPVPADTPAAISSPAGAIRGLLAAATADDADWGAPLAVTLPALTVTAGEMVDVLARVAGTGAAARVDWAPDEPIATIVRSWPARLSTERAAGLGLHAEPDFETIVRAYVAEQAAEVTPA